MTDNKIIKGLEICCRDTTCDGCPYVGRCRYGENLLKDVIDLINRQKAEMERLKVGADNDR